METSPRKLEDFPEYAQAQARLGEAQLGLRGCEEKINELLHQIGWPHIPLLQERAERWLDGGGDPGGGDPGLREELTQLYGKKQVLMEAVRLQRRRVDLLGAELSREITERLRPEHIKIVVRVVVAIKELAELNRLERLFREELTSNGVSYLSHLRPLSFFPAGDLQDDYSGASLYLKEVLEHCPEALGLPPTPPPSPEKKPLLRRVKEALTKEEEWTAAG